MKKQLQEHTVANELRGGSAFFPGVPSARQEPPEATVAPVFPVPAPTIERNHTAALPRNHDTTPPRYRATTADGAVGGEAEVLEAVRAAAKRPGKEAATYRFTRDEKQALAEIVYRYRGQGVRTSENEI